MLLKKIDRYILKSFIGPYLLSFFIAEFVLVMQLLWKYIDEILGKGITTLEFLELILYYGLTIIPMALPISILIASVMVFGDLAEKYELSSMKSAGISLFRILRAGFILGVGTMVFSLFASNFLKPIATFQFKKRFESIRRQKPLLSIEEGVFNNDFRNFIIRIDEKMDDGVKAKGILLYDNSEVDPSMLNMISSDSCRMFNMEDGRYFVMELTSGTQYRELVRESKSQTSSTYPFIRTQFDTWTKVFDMQEFYIAEDEFSFSRNKEDMLNAKQLLIEKDSVDAKIQKTYQSLDYNYGGILNANVFQNTKAKVDSSVISDPKIQEKLVAEVAKKIDSLKSQQGPENFDSQKPQTTQNQIEQSIRSAESPSNSIYTRGIRRKVQEDANSPVSSFAATIDSADFAYVIPRAASLATVRQDYLINSRYALAEQTKNKGYLLLRFNQQFAFGAVCLIFLFIGAPLGSIIRKGGYGYPMLVAIIFYMVFIISTIFGEKLFKNDTLSGPEAAWISSMILMPFAILFTYLALNDVKMGSFGLGSKLSQIVSAGQSLLEKFRKPSPLG